jgi:hypothetical protein
MPATSYMAAYWPQHQAPKGHNYHMPVPCLILDRTATMMKSCQNGSVIMAPGSFLGRNGELTSLHRKTRALPCLHGENGGIIISQQHQVPPTKTYVFSKPPNNRCYARFGISAAFVLSPKCEKHGFRIGPRGPHIRIQRKQHLSSI